MKIGKLTTPGAITVELGRRIAQRRIALGMTQAQVAQKAGVGKRTIERIEVGNDTQLTTLIRLLRILDLTEHLDQLIPETTVSPMQMFKNQIKTQKRARPKRTVKSDKSWKWGDEQ